MAAMVQNDNLPSDPGVRLSKQTQWQLLKNKKVHKIIC